MKNLIAGLFLVVFTFVAHAQDAATNNVQIISLEQTLGEFTQKTLTVKEGTYIFEVSNNNAAPEVGLVLIEAGKDGTNPENHIADAYVSQMVTHGKTESSKQVALTKGTYQYFCPFNKTPQYTLVVE